MFKDSSFQRENPKNRPADIAKLDLHGWNGNLIDRIKAHTTEKHKGALMISRLKDVFGLSDEQIKQSLHQENEKVLEENHKVPEWKRTIVWKRDARGNII